jgi:hypothetical protein
MSSHGHSGEGLTKPPLNALTQSKKTTVMLSAPLGLQAFSISRAGAGGFHDQVQQTYIIWIIARRQRIANGRCPPAAANRRRLRPGLIRSARLARNTYSGRPSVSRAQGHPVPRCLCEKATGPVAIVNRTELVGPITRWPSLRAAP